jgi:hypothetical protein
MTKSEAILYLEQGDWKNASPDFLNLWRNISNKINYNTITPIFFEGNLGATEFETYVLGKLYIGLYFSTGGDTIMYDRSLSVAYTQLFDENNTLISTYSNYQCFYDTTGLKTMFKSNPLYYNNIYFSRINAIDSVSFIFNGYRLNI